MGLISSLTERIYQCFLLASPPPPSATEAKSVASVADTLSPILAVIGNFLVVLALVWVLFKVGKLIDGLSESVRRDRDDI